MKSKTTWVLIVLFGALGAYLYFVDQPRERAATAEKDKEGLLFPGFEPARVTEVLLEGKKGRIRLRREAGDRWTALEPVEDAGDGVRIRTLLEDIKALRADRDVARPGEDLKPFGLDAPELTVKTTGQPATLAIGSANPSADGRYFQVSGGPVRLVKSYALEGLLVAPDDLRSREIFASFPWDKLRAITVADSKGIRLKLAKAAGRWRLEAPMALEADPDAADGLVEKLRWGKIVSFVPDGAEVQASLAKGLSVSLSAEDLAQPAVLRLAEADGAVRGQAGGRNAVFTIDKAVLEAFRQSPADLRRTKPALAKTWSAEKLEISAGEKSTRYEKAEGAWRKAGVAVRGEEGDALRQLLQILEEQKASRIIDSPGSDTRYGLEHPRVTVKLSDSQNPEQLLVIGEKDHAVYARTGKSGPVYVMAQDYLSRFLSVLKLSSTPAANPGAQGNGARAGRP